MKEIAIIGSTASGKTSLAVETALQTNSIILSVDSLSVYRYIDIASAKPTIEEQAGIKHFGIDILNPNETFDVTQFLNEYNKAKQYAQEHGKNLIIVGGTGFYLKVLIDGISSLPTLDTHSKLWVKEKLENLSDAYHFMYELDPEYMKKIEKSDKYRIEKALSIYKQTNTIPTLYFQKNKPVPIAPNLELFEILWDPNDLRERIKLRTQLMIDEGLIDEVIMLEKKYTREPNSMQSIGIIETLRYLDGFINKKQLFEEISTHTAQLAKRQRTFNKNQFHQKQNKNLLNDLKKDIFKFF